MRSSGSRSYPVGYGFDAQGRIRFMTNWSGFAFGAGARVTTRNYDSTRGWLASKVDAESQATTYGYAAAGRLASRL